MKPGFDRLLIAAYLIERGLLTHSRQWLNFRPNLGPTSKIMNFFLFRLLTNNLIKISVKRYHVSHATLIEINYFILFCCAKLQHASFYLQEHKQIESMARMNFGNIAEMGTRLLVVPLQLKFKTMGHYFNRVSRVGLATKFLRVIMIDNGLKVKTEGPKETAIFL